MMIRRRLFALEAAAAVAALVLWGCARKAVQTPPSPAPPPAEQTSPPPTPTPTPPAETPPAPAVTVELHDAFFDFDSAVLRADAREALDRSAKLLRDNQDLRIVIEGHCDERGTVDYNLALGERRANAGRDYLVAAGINSSRVEIVSYGKERPFDSGHGEEAWAKNRRAHLVRR